MLQYHQQTLVNLVHAQMQDHYEEKAAAYEEHVSKGFTALRPNNYLAPAKWCIYATAHEKKHGGKPWTYLLIPHDAIADNKTIQGLAATYAFDSAANALTGGMRS